jgi:hypothetical protein
MKYLTARAGPEGVIIKIMISTVVYDENKLLSSEAKPRLKQGHL